jgi:NADPH-dependent 2,4-dienoyl-CoA reductase/sulfur reductase-like enzyme
MKYKNVDIAVIGAGAAGLSASAICAQKGLHTLVIDREEAPGGVLLQCIHNGFGLHYFHEELTGPEYASRLVEKARASGVEFQMEACVMKLRDLGGEKELTIYSGADGVTVVRAKAIILAMGCRERNRGNLGIPGDRVAGVFTAGLAQRFLNMDGFIPGSSAVIVGSGDIGLIMARRLTWCGIQVKAVVEILPYPSGLSRNIAQCLDDFGIPLRLSTGVTGIHGRDRVESISIAPLVNGEPDLSREETIACDTVLFSVGLIPENELSRQCGVEINPSTNGAFVDGSLMTGVPGIFACGNVLHVHDLVDFVSEESENCAANAVEYVKNGPHAGEKQLRTIATENLSYVVPNACRKGVATRFYMRPKVLCRKAELLVKGADGAVLLRKKVQYVKPAEMITVELPGELTASCPEKTELRFELNPAGEEKA